MRSSLLSGEDAPLFFDVIEEIERASRFAWIPLSACLYMPLEDGDFLEINETAPAFFEIHGCVKGDFQVIGCGGTRAQALEIADDWLAAGQRASKLLRRDEPWRKRAASEKQILLAAELTGLSVTQLSDLTSGNASDLIRSAYALRQSPAELIYARAALSVGSNSAKIPHAWQISNSSSI